MTIVAVIGASENPKRVSHLSVQRLLAAGHEVVPVNPRGGVVSGLPVLVSLRDADCTIDTVTMYVAPQHQAAVIDDLVALSPRRIIFNPGSENPTAYPLLRSAGIDIEEACTLVLLSTGQF